MANQMVSDIPSGILACKIDGVEVKIKEISPFEVKILSVDYLDEARVMEFSYYILDMRKYKTIGIRDFKNVGVEKKEFYNIYVYQIDNLQYKEMIDFVFKQYYRYIMLKMNSYDNSFSEELVGYPAELDETFGTSFSDEKWIETISVLDKEIAISLENTTLWEAYLKDELHQYIDDRIIRKCTRIYVGNTFCHHLFPNDEILKRIIQKAKTEKKKVSIVCSVLKENQIEVWKERFQNLEANEYVINDWGYLPLLEKYTSVKISLGVLLNKRRKDPRYVYRMADDSVNIGENSINTEVMQELCERYNISRIEYELCGYEISYAKQNASLHLPFAQTNTAGHCTMYALCKNGDREMQEEVRECPRYCESHVLLYPEHLRMIGRYNSLFMWNDPQKIDEKVDRIVWNMR